MHIKSKITRKPTSHLTKFERNSTHRHPEFLKSCVPSFIIVYHTSSCFIHPHASFIVVLSVVVLAQLHTILIMKREYPDSPGPSQPRDANELENPELKVKEARCDVPPWRFWQHQGFHIESESSGNSRKTNPTAQDIEAVEHAAYTWDNPFCPRCKLIVKEDDDYVRTQRKCWHRACQEEVDANSWGKTESDICAYCYQPGTDGCRYHPWCRELATETWHQKRYQQKLKQDLCPGCKSWLGPDTFCHWSNSGRRWCIYCWKDRVNSNSESVQQQRSHGAP